MGGRCSVDPSGARGPGERGAGLPADLRRTGPSAPVLARLDPRLRDPVKLAPREFDALVEFVRTGLLDPGARPQRLRKLVPRTLPSGRAPLDFRFF